MLKEIKNGLIFGLSATLVFMLAGVSYAAWTTLSTATTGETLTATKWNEVIDRLNAIDQKSIATSWVSFDANSCTSGVGGDECIIEDSFNVNKIARVSNGYYILSFDSAMDNANYSGNITIAPTGASSGVRIGLFGGFPYRSIPYNKTTTSVTVAIGNSVNSVASNPGIVSVQVFGGKN